MIREDREREREMEGERKGGREREREGGRDGMGREKDGWMKDTYAGSSGWGANATSLSSP